MREKEVGEMIGLKNQVKVVFRELLLHGNNTGVVHQNIHLNTEIKCVYGPDRNPL